LDRDGAGWEGGHAERLGPRIQKRDPESGSLFVNQWEEYLAYTDVNDAAGRRIPAMVG